MEIGSVASSWPRAAFAAAPNSLPKTTGRKDLDALLTGTTRWWHDSSGAVATASSTGLSTARHTLTFSFMSVANSLRANDLYGFQAMTDTTKAAVRRALDYVSTVGRRIDSGVSLDAAPSADERIAALLPKTKGATRDAAVGALASRPAWGRS